MTPPSFLVLGTDTDAGKTTFCLLWLAAFGDRYAYWKPVETGPSDAAAIRRLVPETLVCPPLLSLSEPVAPPLAARLENRTIPPAADIAAQRPHPADRALLVETFGGPWSPLNETEPQIALVHRLDLPSLLISSSLLGAIGRTLSCLTALAHEGLSPRLVVLLGPVDAFAQEQLARHQDLPVVCLTPPTEWTPEGIRQASVEQHSTLQEIAAALSIPPLPPDRDWPARDAKSVWHPYTALRSPAPPVCVGAEEEFLILEDGRRLVDAISSWWTILHGHRDPDLMRALRQASEQIDHVLFAGLTHPWGIALAELLLTTAGMEGGRAFYSDNGSTAVEVALKMAFQFWNLQNQPQRARFIGFEQGYHGDTFGAMAVSRDPTFFGRFEPLLFQADILPLDPQRLEEHLKTRANAIAGVIVEPLVQGAGGMRMHSPRVLADLFAVTRRHDVLFIADEVMTGGGRTGTLWAFQQAGIQPDLICSSKTLTGGVLPLAATLASPRVLAPFDSADRRHTFFHGHSFTGHPLACALALASWKKLLAHSWAPNAMNPPRRIEAFWRRALAPLRDHPRVRDLRIQGSIAAIELDAPGGYLSESARALPQAAAQQGVFLRPLGNVVYALPPYCVSEESLQRIAAVLVGAAG